jgi:DNA-directed RNA polymerase specialized sigma24 family protein
VDIAEDVAQAAWLQGWQKLHQLRDERMILSWVNAIALNYHRRRGQNDSRYQALSEVPAVSGVDLLSWM